MLWGTRMEPLILEQAARDLKLEVRANALNATRYVRRGPVGCTRDAEVICPERGPGALEVKCVFDYRTWMQEWGGGSFVPRHIEIQHQTQMLVGDGEKSFEWGVIAVWVAATMYYFERTPAVTLQPTIYIKASSFLQSVRDRIEPDPFGSPVELPLIYELCPTQENTFLDLREDEAESLLYTDKARMYAHITRERKAVNGVAETLRAELIAKLRGHEKMLLDGGAVVEMGKRNRLKVYVPGVPDAEGGE